MPSALFLQCSDILRIYMTNHRGIRDVWLNNSHRKTMTQKASIASDDLTKWQQQIRSTHYQASSARVSGYPTEINEINYETCWPGLITDYYQCYQVENISFLITTCLNFKCLIIGYIFSLGSHLISLPLSCQLNRMKYHKCSRSIVCHYWPQHKCNLILRGSFCWCCKSVSG